MFGSTILEVGIGLVFVYLVLSLICSAVNEWIASSLLNLRSKTLEEGINKLLGDLKTAEDTKVADIFYDHPLIEAITGKNKKPSYISPQTFSITVLDILVPIKEASSERWLGSIHKTIRDLPESKTRQVLLNLLHEARGDLSEFRKGIEDWFNDAMDRVSGWYKRNLQVITLIISLVMSIGLNVDSFAIANHLYRDAASRTAIVAAAEEAARQPFMGESESLAGRLNELEDQLQGINLPLGWRDSKVLPAPGDAMGWVYKIWGWIFTTFALSLGAPFWFDILSKFVNVRFAGKRPEAKEK
jgi:hypothetical protein